MRSLPEGGRSPDWHLSGACEDLKVQMEVRSWLSFLGQHVLGPPRLSFTWACHSGLGGALLQAQGAALGCAVTGHRRRGCQHRSLQGGPWGAKDPAVEEEVGGEDGVRCSACSMDKRHGQQSQPANGMIATNRCALCRWTRVGAAGEGGMSQAAECLCEGSFTTLAQAFPQPRGDLCIYLSRPWCFW